MSNAEVPWQRHSGRPLLMGVINVTPDSFSDGGQNLKPEAAIKAGKAMIAEGADIIDVGGESTRPGHTPIDAAAEQARILPVIEALGAEKSVRISIDTYKASTARSALKAGAHIINDVWGFQRDPDMANVAAEIGAPAILMHNREANDDTIDILSDVMRFLEKSLKIASKAGVADDKIMLDPGFGFGKNSKQNMHILQNLELISSLGFPILIGLSRKRFIGFYSGQAETSARLPGTLTANLLATISGHAACIRVHDVRPHREMLDFLGAFTRGANN